MIAKTLRNPDGDFFIEIPLVAEVEVSGKWRGFAQLRQSRDLEGMTSGKGGGMKSDDVRASRHSERTFALS
jgi:hypothetical protein